MAKAEFKRIDNGYRVTPDYIGFGWRIEGENYTSAGEPKYLIRVSKKMASTMSSNYETYELCDYGLNIYIGFYRLKDAKEWAKTNRRK